jgi:type II secretory ATPase GspE/PulE/Tfp pilus assembly ATPase PilB-like protein
LRVSIMPCNHGENLVLRILDRAAGGLQLPALGVDPRTTRRLEQVCARPHGLMLVTGPTGSGKTTTLYAMLGCVDAMHRNVATIEDPVEYDMPLVRQSQVDNSAGFGFPEGLRALLRQDPDVILVGEIRDAITADMAMKASMTGHLVFSTLHTNNSIAAVSRLVNLGIPSYVVEECLIGVLSQRLVRRVCDSCNESVEPSEEERRWLGSDIESLQRGRGCELCKGEGYAGRSVISELFLPDDATAQAIGRSAEAHEILALAHAAGFESILVDGRRKVSKGVTTMDEVLRTCRGLRFEEEGRAGL